VNRFGRVTVLSIFALLAILLSGCQLATPTGSAAVGVEQLVSLSFVDSLHGWTISSSCPSAAACRAQVYGTTDGGRTWAAAGRLLLTPIKLAMLDSGVGWLIGSIGSTCGTDVCPNVIMLSLNAGASWDRVSTVSGALVDLSTLSTNDAWAVASLCRSENTCTAILVKTASQGQIWVNQELPLVGRSFQLARLDPQRAWVGAAGSAAGQPVSLVATGDGGLTWQSWETPCRARAYALDYQSASDGWLLCDAGGTSSDSLALYHSADSGRSWTMTGPVGPLPPDTATGAPATVGAVTATPNRLVSGFSFLSPNLGWVSLTSGALLVTSDAGKTWRSALRTDEPLAGVSFVDSGHGWALASRSVWTTSDAGQTWTKSAVLPTAADFRPIVGEFADGKVK
jgi:photosystem II stability/assembly factor-like uncharacterized protein